MKKQYGLLMAAFVFFAGGFFAGLIGQHYGWRSSFIIFGGCGVLLGLVRLLPGGLAGSLVVHLAVNLGALLLVC